MGTLVKAEFRKIFTINLWWALLVPIAVLSFCAGWFGTYFGSIDQIQQELGTTLPVGLLTVAMSTNFSTIFAALFGAMAVSAEHRNRSITTTFLTGNPRGAVIGSKFTAYTSVGLGYGLVNVLFASLGGLLGAGIDGFGNPLDWFAVGGAGLLAMVLWTVLGVGFGALVANSVVAIISLLVYKFVFESILAAMFTGAGVSAAGAYLPAAAGNGIVGNVAVPIFVRDLATATGQYVPRQISDALNVFAGGSYGHPWWASLLTFAGYVAVFAVGGWLLSRHRDIT